MSDLGDWLSEQVEAVETALLDWLEEANQKLNDVGKVTWDFKPGARGHFWLNVKIPTKTSRNQANIVLKIRLKDNFSGKRTRQGNQADPFYETDQPPFQYRVDVRRHKINVPELVPIWDPNEHKMLNELRNKVKNHVTVAVQLFVLPGVVVQPKLLNPVTGKISTFKPSRVTLGMLTINVSTTVLQDRTQMPEEGLPVKQNVVYPQFESDNDDRNDSPLWKGLNRFTIRYVPNGVEITWHGTGQVLKLHLADPNDGISGFSLHFNAEPEFPPSNPSSSFKAYDDLLHIHICGKVKMSLSPIKFPRSGVKNPAFESQFYKQYFVDPIAWKEKSYPMFRQDRNTIAPGNFQHVASIHRPLGEALFFRLQKDTSLLNLPQPNAEFSVKPDRDLARKDYAKYYTNPKTPLSLKLTFDIAIGFIPIIGDFVDYTEFNYMLATGKDRWGDDVTNTDILLAGIAVIPIFGIVGNSALAIRRISKSQ